MSAMRIGSPIFSAKSLPFYYGWVVVGVGFITLGTAFGLWYSYSVFILAIVREFGWTKAGVSSIFSIFLLSHALMAPLAGHLQDRFGPKIVMSIGSLILALSLSATSQAQSMWHFIISYGVVGGIGVSLLGMSSHSAIIPRWFHRKRGLAIGIAMSGIGVGMFVMIPIVERLISTCGWRRTYLILAAVVLFLVAPLNVAFSSKSPDEMGLQPDGDSGEKRIGGSTSNRVIRVIDAHWAMQRWTLRSASGTRRFWYMASAFFFGSFAYQGILLHSVSVMVESGLERNVAAQYFGLLGIFGGVGKILLGHMSDLFGRERVNTLGGAFAVAGILCLMMSGFFHSSLPLLFAILFGVGYGAAAPLFPSIAADIFQGNAFGLIFAMIYIGGGAGGAIGSLLGGYLRDSSGDYVSSLALCAFSLVMSVTRIWFASPRKVRTMIRKESTLG